MVLEWITSGGICRNTATESFRSASETFCSNVGDSQIPSHKPPEQQSFRLPVCSAKT